MTNGCLTVDLARVGGLSGSASLLPSACTYSATRQDGMTASVELCEGIKTVVTKVRSCLRFTFGIVCKAGASERVLWASDGILFTVDDGYLYVD